MLGIPGSSPGMAPLKICIISYSTKYILILRLIFSKIQRDLIFAQVIQIQ